MQACKILLIVFTITCISCPALAEKQDTKGSSSTDGLKVSLGDRTAQVRSVYGEPDRVDRFGIRPESAGRQKEHWMYTQKGLGFWFTKNVLRKIDIGRKYRGSIEGIYVGDPRQVVKEKMGSPDYEESDSEWVYYRGRWSQRISMHVLFGGNDRVTKIRLMR